MEVINLYLTIDTIFKRLESDEFMFPVVDKELSSAMYKRLLDSAIYHCVDYIVQLHKSVHYSISLLELADELFNELNLRISNKEDFTVDIVNMSRNMLSTATYNNDIGSLINKSRKYEVLLVARKIPDLRHFTEMKLKYTKLNPNKDIIIYAFMRGYEKLLEIKKSLDDPYAREMKYIHKELDKDSYYEVMIVLKDNLTKEQTLSYTGSEPVIFFSFTTGEKAIHGLKNLRIKFLAGRIDNDNQSIYDLLN